MVFPHLPHFRLAVPRAHMRQDVDRRVGEEIDVVRAVRQRALDIAGLEIIERREHALAVE